MIVFYIFTIHTLVLYSVLNKSHSYCRHKRLRVDSFALDCIQKAPVPSCTSARTLVCYLTAQFNLSEYEKRTIFSHIFLTSNVFSFSSTNRAIRFQHTHPRPISVVGGYSYPKFQPAVLAHKILLHHKRITSDFHTISNISRIVLATSAFSNATPWRFL